MPRRSRPRASPGSSADASGPARHMPVTPRDPARARTAARAGLRRALAPAMAAAAIGIVVAACGSTIPPTWTMPPAAAVAPSTPSPTSPSPSPVASASPTPASASPLAIERAVPGRIAVDRPVTRPLGIPAGGRLDVRQEGAVPGEPFRVRHARPCPATTSPRAAPPGTSRSRSNARAGSGSGRTSSSPAARVRAESRSPTATPTTTRPASPSTGHRVPRPARHRAVASLPCPDATATYYDSDARPQDPAQGTAAGAAADAYVDACLAEAGVPEADLPLYSTEQAIEDLEAIRQYLDVDTLDLYGESYGTQYVQTYATKYPEHITAAVSRRARGPDARRGDVLRGGRRTRSTTCWSRRSTTVRPTRVRSRLRRQGSARRRTTSWPPVSRPLPSRSTSRRATGRPSDGRSR